MKVLEMSTFGLSQAGGRRVVPRVETPLRAIISMSAGDYDAAIVDVSRTGARLSGHYLPSEGQHVIFKAENVFAAATVVWSERGSCAIEFDTPIAIAEVQRLRWTGLESRSHSSNTAQEDGASFACGSGR